MHRLSAVGSLLVGAPLIGALLVGAIRVERAASAQHVAMPAGMTHEEHLAQMDKEKAMKERGALAMGFDQDKTTHHFVLTASGGFISVEVKDPADARSRDAIRIHLKAIAEEFASGDFGKPFQTHAEAPPGVQTLQRLKAAVAYRFEETERGGRVRISTKDADALHAVHEFLSYQITEHTTGDPLTVQR